MIGRTDRAESLLASADSITSGDAIRGVAKRYKVGGVLDPSSK